MRQIDLREHTRSEPIQLSPAERDALLGHRQLLDREVFTIEPVAGDDHRYRLTPGSVVGAFHVGDLAVSIRPKLDISRVLFLASYAMGAFKLRERDDHDFERAESLVEALASALVDAAQRAFAQGLLQGYRTEEEALHMVRGRMRIEEQARRRFGALVPVEVRYDDFTADILANRLVKAAVLVLQRMQIRYSATRSGLVRVRALLDTVRTEEFPPNRVPEVVFDRLSQHYRQVVALSRLVLRHASFESARGNVQAQGFLVNMNVVFQEFLTRALREELRVSEWTFRSDRGRWPERCWLDEGRQIDLRPDLSWWEGGRCTFVGDAKYKRMKDESVPNADLYQILAYATALGLPGGLLVYAKGETEPVKHLVRHSDVRIEVAAVDLAGTIDELLARVADIAARVRALRREAHGADTPPLDEPSPDPLPPYYSTKEV